MVASLQEQAAALHALGMLDYGEMKARLMLTTAALVATGSTICWIHGDTGVHRTSLRGRLWKETGA